MDSSKKKSEYINVWDKYKDVNLLKGLKYKKPTIKDPIRYPKIQKKLEDQMKKNYKTTIKLMLSSIGKKLK